MSEEITPQSAGSSSMQRIIGGVLLIPALICCLTELLIPTVRTVLMSLQDVDLLSQDSNFVGLDNYGRLVSENNFGTALSFTLAFVIVNLALFAVVPPVLGWSLSRVGRSLRLGVRILLTIPLVLFIPVPFSVIWMMAFSPQNDLFGSETPLLANPDTAPVALLLVNSLYVFGLFCALGVIIYPAIWRRDESSTPPTCREAIKPLIAAWSVGLLATIALSLTVFTPIFIMTRGGPANSTQTLAFLQYIFSFQFFQLGVGAALASIFLLIMLPLGIVAGLIIILTRLQLTTVASTQSQADKETEKPIASSKALPLIVLILTLLVSLSVCAFGALPYGWTIGQSGGFGQLGEQISTGSTFVNSIIPPLLAAIIQLLIAYLAGLSIGAMRPLGKQSHWLLLLFSPWLFVPLLPLSIISFLGARDFGTLNSFIGLIPPILLSVPALFILALFFRGQASRRQSNPDGSFLKQLILPSLPLTGVLLLFLFFFGWQDTLWPLLVANSQDYAPFSLTLMRLQGQFIGDNELISAAVTLFTLPIVIFFLVAFVVAHIFYLDKLAWQTD